MEYLAHILAIAGIYVILTMSLNLIVGYAGLPAMGHSAFFCLGAYASSLLALNAGLSPWIGILCAAVIGMSQGDALLFAGLCASASYIAVPAAMRMSVPEANPSLYISMALALTFPFNIVVGIPIYFEIIKKLWGAT